LQVTVKLEIALDFSRNRPSQRFPWRFLQKTLPHIFVASMQLLIVAALTSCFFIHRGQNIRRISSAMVDWNTYCIG
jgi:hypothetical protein